MIIDPLRISKINNIGDFNIKVLEAGLYYASVGIPVVPLVKNSKKLPPKKSGVNYGSATTDANVINKWFNPNGGQFIGGNIGIGCGKYGTGGIFVVDIDTHGGKDGFGSWDDVSRGFPTFSTATQSTADGGMHLVFRHFPHGKSSSEKLGVGIDTLGGVGGVKSHIVAFPSEINGKSYSWFRTGNISPPPQELVQLIESSTLQNPPIGQGGNRGNEAVTNSDKYSEIISSEVATMLGFIDIEAVSYEDWVRVGMVIHHQNYKDGLRIWKKWSSGGSRYKRGECDSRWDGFSASSGGSRVSLGTIIFMAQQGGWTSAETVVPNKDPQLPPVSVTDRLNQNCFVDTSSNRFRICIDPDDKNRPLRIMSRPDFIHCFENQMITVMGKPKNPATMWLASGNRRELHGFKFKPNESKETSESRGYYNLFDGFPCSPARINSQGREKFLDFVLQVICNGNPTLSKWVLDWWADLFQNPAYPKGTALVLIGDEGIGKGALVSILKPLLGKYYNKDNGGAKISGRFNGFLETSLLLFADEMTRATGIRIQQTLKALITGDELLIEDKGLDIRSIAMVARVIIASNDYEVIRGEKTSRRYLSLEVSNGKINNHKYFDDLFEHCTGNNFHGDMMDFFLNRDIGTGSHLRKAPSTILLEQQKIAHITASNNVLLWLIHLIDNNTLNIVDVKNRELDVSKWASLINRVDAKVEYETWCTSLKHTPISSIMFYRTMRDVGFKDGHTKINGSVLRTFNVPDIAALKEAISGIIGADWNTIDKA